MATGNDVINYMPLSSSARTAADDLRAVNFALTASWPAFKLEEYSSAATLALGTYEYALSALDPQPSVELGVAIAEVSVSDTEPPIVVSHVKQRYSVSDGYWTLLVPSEMARSWAGKSVYVRYQYPHPTLTSLGETVYVPLHVCSQLAMLWYAHYLATGSNYDSAFNRAIAPEFYRIDALARRAFVPQLPNKVPIVGREQL